MESNFNQSPSSSFLEESQKTSQTAWYSPRYEDTQTSPGSPMKPLHINKENTSVSNLSQPQISDLIAKTSTNEHRLLIAEMTATWDEMQLPTEELTRRFRAILEELDEHTTKVLIHSRDCQVFYLKNLEERVERYLKDIRVAEELLDLPPQSTSGSENDGGEVGLYQREIMLRTRCNELVTLRKKRTKMWNFFLEENEKFSKAVGVASFHLLDQNLRLRTETLEQLRSCNNELQTVFVTRSKTMANLRERLENVTQQLRLSSSSSQNWEDLTENNLASIECLLNQLEEVKSENVKKGVAIVTRIKEVCLRMEISSLLLENQPTILQRLYDPHVLEQLEVEKEKLELEAKQNIQNVILRFRERISTLYETTFASQTERETFTAFTSEEYDEDLLTKHVNEMNRLDELLEANRTVYALLQEHASLTREKLKYEEEEADPVVMVNRGGILLKIQAEKKKVLRDLHKVLIDLRAEVESKTTSEGEPFLIGGLNLEEFLMKKNRETENEKADFIKEKKKTAFGSALKRGGKDAWGDTPTLKRLKTAVEAGQDKKEPKSGKGKVVEPKAKGPSKMTGTDSADRIGRIKKRLEFDVSGPGGAGKPRPLVRGGDNTPASANNSHNLTFIKEKK